MDIKVSEQDFGERHIRLLNLSGDSFSATVKLVSRDWSQGRYRTECQITLTTQDYELKALGPDFFEAFCGIRDQLAQLHLVPFCYGASLRTLSTGMCRDMALGLKIWRVLPPNSPEPMELVDLFDYGDDVEPTSLEAQLEFQREYFRNEKRSDKS